MGYIKQTIMVVWGLLECLFFTGVVFGWLWLVQILKYDNYFIDLCNNTNATLAAYPTRDTHSVALESYPICSGHPRDSLPCVDLLSLSANTSNKKGNNTTDGYRTSSIATTHSKMSKNESLCTDIDDTFGLFNSLIYTIRNILVLPAGIFYDKYGTMRTRLLCVLLFAISTLMMTFSSSSVPWLIVPALSLTSLSGMVVLMTNIQIGNVFGSRRYTVMTAYVGAFHSSGVIAILMRASHYGDINLQTSFMFLTIGVVPILVSTIAFLPKSRIPWPLPAGYGKKHGSAVDEVLYRQQLAWQRKQSGQNKPRKDVTQLSVVICQPLYLWSVAWVSVHLLKFCLYDASFTLWVRRAGISREDTPLFEEINTGIHMLAIFISPAIGLVMDRQNQPDSGSKPCTRQMQNIMSALAFTGAVSLLDSILTLIPSLPVSVTVFLLQIILRVAIYGTAFAFLTHVHFPPEHFGKLFGITLVASAVLSLIQFVAKPMLNTVLNRDPFYIQLFVLILVLVVLIHPVNVWRHCKLGLIKDSTVLEMERRRRSMTEAMVQRFPIQSKSDETRELQLPEEIPDISDTTL